MTSRFANFNLLLFFLLVSAQSFVFGSKKSELKGIATISKDLVLKKQALFQQQHSNDVKKALAVYVAAGVTAAGSFGLGYKLCKNKPAGDDSQLNDVEILRLRKLAQDADQNEFKFIGNYVLKSCFFGGLFSFIYAVKDVSVSFLKKLWPNVEQSLNLRLSKFSGSSYSFSQIISVLKSEKNINDIGVEVFLKEVRNDLLDLYAYSLFALENGVAQEDRLRFSCGICPVLISHLNQVIDDFNKDSDLFEKNPDCAENLICSCQYLSGNLK